MSALLDLLDRADQRAKAATQGPWREVYAYRKDTPGTLVAATFAGHQVHTDAEGGTSPSNDLAFIAAARTDVPALVAALRIGIEALELARDRGGIPADDFYAKHGTEARDKRRPTWQILDDALARMERAAEGTT